MSFNELPADLLSELLHDTDDFAVQNVKADRGGPFGASIHVLDTSTNELTQIGGIAANAVLATGMGSAHAEDQVMNPDNVRELKSLLSQSNNKDDLTIIMSSSGQSCPACHSKQEILSRTLMSEGLINSGGFVVTYGATYKDTAEIAGFNDEPYHEDMQKPVGSGMISVDEEDISGIPKDIAQLFESSNTPVSVILMADGVLIDGYADRENDLMATSEVVAIRNAAQYQKDMNIECPWDLGGATIYTSTSQVGPLGYAECQWANVTDWIAVDHLRAKEWATKEAPDISNDAFFMVIASKDYNGSEVSIEVRRLEPFDNKAQYEWRNKEDRVLYNGIECD